MVGNHRFTGLCLAVKSASCPRAFQTQRVRDYQRRYYDKPYRLPVMPSRSKIVGRTTRDVSGNHIHREARGAAIAARLVLFSDESTGREKKKKSNGNKRKTERTRIFRRFPDDDETARPPDGRFDARGLHGCVRPGRRRVVSVTIRTRVDRRATMALPRSTVPVRDVVTTISFADLISVGPKRNVLTTRVKRIQGDTRT